MTVSIEIHPTRPDRIAITAAYRYKDLIKTCPGARWSKDEGQWSVPLAWTACLAMRGIFGALLEIGPELHKWAYVHKTNIVEPALVMRNATDAPGDERLYSFQRAGVAYLKFMRRTLLCDEMGVGKTVQAITALRELEEDGQLGKGKILIVCPNTMKHTWRNELGIWWPGKTCVVVQGTAMQRQKQLAQDVDIIIINWESLRSHSRLLHFGSTALKVCEKCAGAAATTKPAQCEKCERELNKIDFDAVVGDEIHRALDPHSKQTRALRAASGDASIRFGLTGTPISKDPTQLWTALNWINEDEWPTKSAWVDRMVDYTTNIFGGKEINGLNPLTQPEFYATVDPVMRRMLKSVVLPFLPPIVRERRNVVMNPKQAKAYKEMRDLMMAQLDSGTLMAGSEMLQVGRLTQLASAYGDVEIVQVPDIDSKTGARKLDEFGNPAFKDAERLVMMDPSCKLDAFMDDLPDYEGQSVAVFGESRPLIEMLSERMVKKSIPHGLITGKVTGEARNKAIEGFQRGDFPFVLVTIRAGGTGITLTRASTAAYIQRNFSPVDMEQAYARCHRIGSEVHESITIVDYVTEDTVEDAQIGILERKGEMLEEIVRDEDKLRAFLSGELVF